MGDSCHLPRHVRVLRLRKQTSNRTPLHQEHTYWNSPETTLDNAIKSKRGLVYAPVHIYVDLQCADPSFYSFSITLAASVEETATNHE